MGENAVRILIVEGNTPDVIARAARVGARPAAETYAAALSLETKARLAFATVNPSEPGFDPASVDLDAQDAAVFTGSGVAWSADDDRAGPHRALMARLLGAGLPVMGSCYGMQLAAVLFGGRVGASPIGREIGVARSIRLTEAGRLHPAFAGKPAVFDSVCIHRDEVTALPSGAVLLAENDHSAVQAFAQDDFVGWQYHPELSLGDIADYLATPGRNVLSGGDQFASEADLQQTIAAFRSIAADPAGAKPLCWRYGVTAHAADPSRRRQELRNWLAMITSRHDRDSHSGASGRARDAGAVSGRLQPGGEPARLSAEPDGSAFQLGAEQRLRS